MTLPVPTSSPAPFSVPDLRLQEALAELLQLGLSVARVAARLAEVEGRAVEALAEAAVAVTTAVVGKHETLAAATLAGHAADVSDAARNAIAARMVSITDTFDKAARAVRRTAALQARIMDGRGFHERTHDKQARRGVAGLAGRVANDADRADPSDEPEWGDEIGDRSDEDVLRDIRRDLVRASAGQDAPGDKPVGPGLAVPTQASGGRIAAGLRREVDSAGAMPARAVGRLREPDT